MLVSCSKAFLAPECQMLWVVTNSSGLLAFLSLPDFKHSFASCKLKPKHRKKARWIFVQKKQLLPILSSGAHDMMNEGRIALATYLFSILLASKYSIQCKAIR